MKKNLVKIIWIVVTLYVTTACVRDTFRYYGYEDQLEGYFPVDSIEKNHTWTLTSVCSSYVTGNVAGAEKVQLLSGNPFDEEDVEILTEATTEARVSRQMTYVVPQVQERIYAAVLDGAGNYLRMVAANVNQETIELGSTVPTGTSTPYATSLQRFYFCFEADYPNPGDWDYNDIVLSATRECVPGKPTVMALHVTLHAVGYLEQIAAAIRVAGYKNVVITQDEATTFVRESDAERTLIKQSNVQLQARDGSAVINLFDDAHLAIFRRAPSGSVYRLFFNTVKNSNVSSNSATQPPVTVTYYLDFGNEHHARHFMLTELDPFLVVKYGQSGDNFWEIHTYPYKLQETLYQYYHGAAVSYNNGFSWALTVPYGKFRYPIEEIPVGMRKNSVTWGAYQTKEHSFGEWILNHNTAKDWFLYPEPGGVY